MEHKDFCKLTRKDYHKKVTITLDLIEWIAIANYIFNGAEMLRKQRYYAVADDALEEREKIMNKVREQIN